MAESASTPGHRVLVGIAAIVAGIVLSALLGGLVVSAAGWDVDVPSGLGDDFGRVAGKLAAGAALDHNRIPLVARVLLNVPLWVCLVGVPFLMLRHHKLDLRRDLGWGLSRRDIGVGLVIGIATQVVLVPLVYLPLSPFIDSESLGAPARDLVASADSLLGVAALVVLTVVGAPIAEEFLYRGVLHRGLADLLADRGLLGTAVAVLGSSTLFAASHFQLLQFPGLLLVGIVTAAAFQITGRLGTPLWIHAGFNATSVVVLLSQLL